MQLRFRSISAAIALALAACGEAPDQADSAPTAAAPATPATTVAPGDWPLINRDLNANRYSPLTEITAANVATLTSSWTHQLGGNSTAVPVVVGGVMYVPSRDRVVALDGDSGTLVWEYVLPAPPPAAGATPAPPWRLAVAARRRRHAASVIGPVTAPHRRVSCS